MIKTFDQSKTYSMFNEKTIAFGQNSVLRIEASSVKA